MYINECTNSYATEVIREILDNAQNDFAALFCIRGFLDGGFSTDNIEVLLNRGDA